MRSARGPVFGITAGIAVREESNVDDHRFDELTRKLATGASRRTILRGIAAAAAVAVTGRSVKSAAAQVGVREEGEPCQPSTGNPQQQCMPGLICIEDNTSSTPVSEDSGVCGTTTTTTTTSTTTTSTTTMMPTTTTTTSTTTQKPGTTTTTTTKKPGTATTTTTKAPTTGGTKLPNTGAGDGTDSGNGAGIAAVLGASALAAEALRRRMQNTEPETK